MDTAPTKFDWISWLSSIPGIPVGWDQSLDRAPAETAAAVAAPIPLRTTARIAANTPELAAA
jgi:hypothetical protein